MHRVLVVALGLAFSSCASEPPPAAGLEFPGVDELSRETQRVVASVGATLILDGAVLEIPAGALAEDATISLVRTTAPLASDDPNDGALGGQLPLWDSGFLVIADSPVVLIAPARLVLPVDPSRLDGADAIWLSSLTGGYLQPQGEVPLTDDRMGVELSLQAGQTIATGTAGPPMPAGVSLITIGIAVLAALPPGIVLAQPVLATIDDVRAIVRFDAVTTTNFRVRYRGTSEADAMEIANQLEAARAILVGEAGMDLPNVGSFFTRYVMYLDDFANHSFFRQDTDEGPRYPDGATFPGSYLWGGASYVNTQIERELWGSTAVHEYVHGLQWGTVGRLSPNSFAERLDPESNWLFEGTATALAGRLVAGGGTVAARDPRLVDRHPSPGNSAYQFGGHQPAADVLQDFFFYVDGRVDDVNIYREFLEATGSDFRGSTIEPSVSAVDSVLVARTGTGLRETWSGFVRDFLWDRPSEYHPESSAPFLPPNTVPVSSDGAARSGIGDVPPLSYSFVYYELPPSDGSARDDVRVELTTEGAIDDVRVLSGLVGESPTVHTLTAGAGTEVVHENVRGPEPRFLQLTFANGALEVDRTARVIARVSLVDAGDIMPPDPDRPAAVVVTLTDASGPLSGAITYQNEGGFDRLTQPIGDAGVYCFRNEPVIQGDLVHVYSRGFVTQTFDLRGMTGVASFDVELAPANPDDESCTNGDFDIREGGRDCGGSCPQSCPTPAGVADGYTCGPDGARVF